MAQIRMKDTNIGSRIDPALYGFRRGRMTMAETRIYNRCPRPWGFWKRRMRFFDWKDFARKLQINSTCIDQSLGTLVRTGSGSPFFSAFITASSYVFRFDASFRSHTSYLHIVCPPNWPQSKLAQPNVQQEHSQVLSFHLVVHCGPEWIRNPLQQLAGGDG